MNFFFVSPRFLEEVIFGIYDLKTFNGHLYNLFDFLSQQREDWGYRIILDIDQVDDSLGLDIYDLRMLASFFVDSSEFCEQPRTYSKAKDYVYYLVPNVAYGKFTETTEKIHIDAAETTEYSRIIDNTLTGLSVLKVQRFELHNAPHLVSISPCNLNTIEIEIFVEKFVRQHFGPNLTEFDKYKKKCLDFYSSFQWHEWSPKENPAPGHDLINELSKFYTRQNDDVHHLHWGYIMAFLNGGRLNKQITLVNKHNPRVNDVFQCGLNKGNNTLFFSIDTENGSLEIYDHNGIHVGKVYGLVSGIKIQNRNYRIKVRQNLWLG